MMNADDITKLEFLLYPHIVGSELDGATVESLAERIKQLQTGLLPEDEFAPMVCWLGNCAGIYRIGQAPMPVPDFPQNMRAPDFIAFPIVNDRPFPVLVEVKSPHHQKIKWSETYRRSLVNFAEQLKLPLLVAWKCGDLWFLVDHRHFARNVTGYRITLEQAFREDLSCLLFRNLRIQMNPELEQLILPNILCPELVGRLAEGLGELGHITNISGNGTCFGGRRSRFRFSCRCARLPEDSLART